MGKPTKEGESPVSEVKATERIPEYRRTREIQREVGVTTLQG